MILFVSFFCVLFYNVFNRLVVVVRIVSKFFVVFISFFIFCSSIFAFEINSDKAILINLTDDSVIYSKNSEEKTSVASLTKMMTAIVAIENIDDFEEKVFVTNEDWKGLVENDASVANFVRYRKYSYMELLYGLMLPSGADAAHALARLVGGNIPNFVKMMNDKAKELGLNNTSFANPTGLDDKNNYSTASDMAMLLKYGIKNEVFKKVITTMEYTTHDGIVLRHTIDKYSKMRNISIPGLLGGKTGSTDDAGVCLASIAEFQGVNYLLVVLNAKFPYQLIDSKTIYEYYMNNYGYQILINKGDVLVNLDTLYTKDKNIDILSKDVYSYYLSNDYEKKNMVLEYDGVDVVTYKMRKGDKLGKVSLYYDEKLMEEIDIYLDRDMSFDLVSFFMTNVVYFVLGFGLLLVLIIVLLVIRHKKKLRKDVVVVDCVEEIL